MNKFKFHPVGQGLFYTGSIASGRYNFVYDCGTESRKHYLHNAIDSYVNELSFNSYNPSIDFVVISHLHSDHFNGLYKLSQRVHIKNVYLPYLGNNKSIIKVILFKKLVIDVNNGNVDAKDFVNVAYELACQLYGVGEGRDFHNIDEPKFLGKESENTIYDEEGFCYSRQVEPSTYHWRFIFLNKTISLQKQQELENNLIRRNVDLNITTLEEIIKNGRIQDIVDAYRDTFKNQNITSTILYHYPIRDKATICFNRRCCMNCGRYCLTKYRSMNNVKQDTLLTGDAEFSNQLVKQMILAESGLTKEKIVVLQVPHHGAKENWIKIDGTGIKAEQYVVSFGLGNKYKHPSIRAVNDILGRKEKIGEVNQISSFEYFIY